MLAPLDLLYTAMTILQSTAPFGVFMNIQLPEGWSLKVSDLAQIAGLFIVISGAIYGVLKQHRENKKGNLELNKTVTEQLKEENVELRKTVTRLRKSEDKMLLFRKVVLGLPDGVALLKQIEKDADEIDSFEP